MAFCNPAKSYPIPATEAMVVMFASHLAVETFINKAYLSGVRHLHVLAGLNDHFNLQLTPRLQQVLKGFKRRQALTDPQEYAFLSFFK